MEKSNKKLKSFTSEFDGDVIAKIPLIDINKNNREYSVETLDQAMSNPAITKFEDNSISHEKPDMNLDALEKFVEEKFGLKFEPYSRIELPIDNNGDEINNLIKEMIVNHTIPESIPDIVSNIDITRHHLIWFHRDRFIQYGSFSLVAYDWVRLLKETIIKDSKCLEIMSGSGMLAKALKDVGCDIIATDNKSWKKGQTCRLPVDWFKNPFTDVEEIDCIDAIEKYGKDVDFIIVSWPYMDDTCYRALLKMREVNPKCIMIYIGEYGDACADENFTKSAQSFDLYMLDESKNHKAIPESYMRMYNNLLKIRELYKSWYGIHDDIYLVK